MLISLMMDLFKVKFKTAVLVSGIIPLFLFPQKLVTQDSAGGLNMFIKLLTAFLAPVIIVMMMDYWVIRKQKLDLDLLYDLDGPYSGTNWAAIIAIVIGAILGLLARDISWMVSSIPTAIIFYVLMKKMPSSQKFWAGTPEYDTAN